MRVAAIPRTVAVLLGGGIAVVTGYLVIRGPFFGGPSLEPVPLMVALGGFLLGVIVFVWGATRMFEIKAV